jgi:hypothetical protein
MAHHICYAIAAAALVSEVRIEAASAHGVSTLGTVCAIGGLCFAAMGFALQVVVHFPVLLEHGRFARKFFHHKVRLRQVRAVTKEPVKP